MFAGKTILSRAGSPRTGRPRSDTGCAAFLARVKAIDRNFNHHLANIRCVLTSIFYVILIHLVAEGRLRWINRRITLAYRTAILVHNESVLTVHPTHNLRTDGFR